MQLQRYADLHCPPLRYTDADRGESRLAINDGVLGSALYRQRHHQAFPLGFLSHVHRSHTCLFRIGNVRIGVLLRLASGSSNVLKRWDVDDLQCLAADHKFRWQLACRSACRQHL